MTRYVPNFDITLGQIGKHGTVLMDGKDITRCVRDVNVHAGTQEITEVTLTMMGTVNQEQSMTTTSTSSSVYVPQYQHNWNPDGRVLDRKPRKDPRSLAYTVELPRKITPAYRRWMPPPALDQGNVGGCVGWGWTGLLATMPGMTTRQRSMAARNVHGKAMYMVSTDVDEYEGEYPTSDTGSSTLGGAKAAQMLGFISSYAWLHTASDIYATVLTLGPVIVGTPWYNTMFEPKLRSGHVYLDVQKASGQAGGHEWFLYATYTNGDLAMQNSWGSEWGDQGRARITQADLDVLLNDDGDACHPTTGIAP